MKRNERMCFWLALILTFSPGEKEQPLCVSGFANDCQANPAARHFNKRGEGFSAIIF